MERRRRGRPTIPALSEEAVDALRRRFDARETTSEVARAWKISEKTLYRLCKDAGFDIATDRFVQHRLITISENAVGVKGVKDDAFV